MNGKLNDVIVWHDGSITLVRPVSDAAEQWIAEHVPDDAPWFGPALAVEPRYVDDLIAGMRDAGLEVV